MARRLLLVLPAVAAVIVLWAVMTAGGPRPVLGVQVLGGPTRGQRVVSLLIRTVTSDGSRPMEAPAVGVRILATASSLGASWEGTTDATGHAEARLEFAQAPTSDPTFWIETASTGVSLAHGTPALDVATWRAGARREGGWIVGQRRGELLVRVAPGRGTLAVPFASDIVVMITASEQERAPGQGGSPWTRVEAHPEPQPNVELRFELEGAEALAPASGITLTDASGMARLKLRPTEHAVALRVTAHRGDHRGEWYGALPVTPGALYASLDGGGLSVSSPIPREHAFVSLVSAEARLAGGVVALTVDAVGGATGRFKLNPALRTRLLEAPSWAVVSSEYDKRSPAVVGWPLQPATTHPFEPPRTFDVGDRLLIDGVAQALAIDSRLRMDRRQVAAALLVVVGALMSALFGYELRRGQRRTTPELVLEPRGWLIVVAIACVVLGVAALAFFGILAR